MAKPCVEPVRGVFIRRLLLLMCPRPSFVYKNYITVSPTEFRSPAGCEWLLLS